MIPESLFFFNIPHRQLESFQDKPGIHAYVLRGNYAEGMEFTFLIGNNPQNNIPLIHSRQPSRKLNYDRDIQLLETPKFLPPKDLTIEELESLRRKNRIRRIQFQPFLGDTVKFRPSMDHFPTSVLGIRFDDSTHTTVFFCPNDLNPKYEFNRMKQGLYVLFKR